MKDDLLNALAIYTDEPVVIDNIITTHTTRFSMDEASLLQY